MSKQTKTSKSAPAPAPAPESTPVTVKTVAPSESQTLALKKVKVKKETQPVAVEVAPVVVVAPPTPVASVSVTETPDAEVSLTTQTGDFFQKLQQLGLVISALKSEYKVLEKKWVRELKLSSKSSQKKKRKTGNRAPSGFVKPTKISDELATFLDKPSGFEMARTEVTRDINQYIRTHNLQDKTNGRRIIPDSKLTNLLKIKTGEELTYFNLQRYMSCHFAKSVKSTETAQVQVSA